MREDPIFYELVKNEPNFLRFVVADCISEILSPIVPLSVSTIQ